MDSLHLLLNREPGTGMDAMSLRAKVLAVDDTTDCRGPSFYIPKERLLGYEGETLA